MAIMGIPGFEPTYLIGVNAIRETHGTRLAALAGRRFTGFALVRFTDDGRWFADCPVVLDFGGVQVEICHWGVNELSISWDGIDTSAAISGGWKRMKRELEWSRSEPRLERFLGLAVHEVALLEWRPGGSARAGWSRWSSHSPTAVSASATDSTRMRSRPATRSPNSRACASIPESNPRVKSPRSGRGIP